ILEVMEQIGSRQQVSSRKIQAQALKVALEFAHLQQLLDHCGNAPCTMSRLLPEPRRHAAGSSNYGSQHEPHSLDFLPPRDDPPPPPSA
ncbi:hypothetical protein KI387_039125, partial [Taxus chinensis]